MKIFLLKNMTLSEQQLALQNVLHQTSHSESLHFIRLKSTSLKSSASLKPSLVLKLYWILLIVVQVLVF